MAYNFQSPFAQALMTEGQRRGANPFAIAASLGNAAIENGLNTNGRPGDGGTAFGGFQWRQERKDALNALAQKMGKSWDDPTVQATHWWNEQDGPEAKWGLKSAQDIEGANRSAISSLRPAGWTYDNPDAGHAYGNRLRASQEALNFINGGQGAGGVNPADLPAPGAEEASFQIPQGVNPPPKEGLEGFLEGGPGALFGKPQEGWNIGDALSGAGIALMARDNPSGASALSSYINGARKASEDKFKTTYDYRSGKLIKMDKNGTVSTTQVTDPQSQNTSTMTKDGKLVTYDDKGNIINSQQVFTPEAKPMPTKAMEMIQKNDETASMAYNTLQDNQYWMRMLKDGKVDLSLAAKPGQAWNTLINDTDEVTRNTALFRQHIERLRNDSLRLNKGTQTEGDAVRELEALLPGLAKYDNKTAALSLAKISKGFESAWTRHNGYNEKIIGQYPSYDEKGTLKDAYKSKYDDYIKSRDALDNDINNWTLAPKPASGAPPVAVSGQNPARQAQPTQEAPAQAPKAIPKDAPRQPNESFQDYFKRRNG